MNMQVSRKQASLISTIIGLVNCAITILLTFFIRTIVLKEFGVEYVGLYSFFSQTVGIFAGIDGGVSSALFIKMHKPIANDNLEEIQHTYFLIRVVYRVRGILVLVIGMIVAMFLPNIVNSSIDMLQIMSCYYSFLVLNSISFFYIYDFFMLETVQKRYIASAVVCVVNVLITGINIYCVYRFHDFFIYILFTSANQVLAYMICRIIFRNIRKQFYKKLNFQMKHFKEMVSLIGMASHTFSNILITNCDTIIMSTMLTLTVTGHYANYYLVLTGVNMIAMQLTLSIKDPFRNMVMTSSNEITQINIKRIIFLYVIVIGSMGITYSALVDSFVGIFWGGENIIADHFTVCLLATSLYLNVVSSPIVDFYYCKEYYKIDKISPLIEIVINIIISVFFAKIIGLNGIIMGTVITYLYRLIHRLKIVSCNFSSGDYITLLLFFTKSAIVFAISSFIFRFLVNTIINNMNIFNLLFCSIAVFCSSFIILCFIYKYSEEMVFFKSYFFEVINNIVIKRIY